MESKQAAARQAEQKEELRWKLVVAPKFSIMHTLDATGLPV